MRVTFESTGNFEETVKWLETASRKSPASALREIGREGVESLKRNTPSGGTGETARGWSYGIETSGDVSELSFVNNAHPGESVSIARIIETGHGTGTGGYVSPRPYIKQAMEKPFSNGIDRIVKEMMD